MVKKGQKPVLANKRKEKKKTQLQYVAELQTGVDELAKETLDAITKFSDLPLSGETKRGLAASHFVEMRDIQKKTILLGLKGDDVLGAAQTGSGKTLAFLIPLLENLFRQSWTDLDGLGALVLSPTRELAIQTYEVLRKIGRYHQFSVALVVGGKDAEEESKRLGRVNILVGTPGRVVHHMHQSLNLNVSNLNTLVLDEADRILDEGFQRDIDSILSDLPTERQTMLFSATQTKKIRDLARLSLNDPKFISTHSSELASTPDTLDQFYIVSNDDHKLNNLYAFIRSHTQSKIIVFMASIKQVRFTFDSFKKLQPGVPLMQLHGKQKQTTRMENTDKFKKLKHACLLTTDVIARGVDFPSVDWVIQVDAPEDVAMYIHRVGRSARNKKKGKSLLFLTAKEEPGFVRELKLHKVPISKQAVKESKKQELRVELQKICYENPDIKVLGQKALQAYAVSISKRKNREVFNYDVKDIPMEEFAQSFGLNGVPSGARFKDLEKARERKNVPRAMLAAADNDGKVPEKKVRTKIQRMFERTNQGVLSEDYLKLQQDEYDINGADSGDEDDFLAKKSNGIHMQLSDNEGHLDHAEPESKRAAKRALSKKAIAKSGSNPTKLVFDDEGNPHALYEFEDEEDFKAAGDAEVQKQEFVSRETQVMQERDVEDKVLAKEKRQEKKRKRQEIERRLRDEMESSDEEVEVRLPSDNERDFANDSESDIESSDEEEDDDDVDEPVRKKSKKKASTDNVLEVEEPETLEDLEALSARLIGRR